MEVLALVCLLPAFLGVQWLDETNRAESLEPPVKVSSIADGKVGELVGARWTLGERKITPRKAAGQDVAELQVALGVKAPTAESAKKVGGYGMEFRFVDEQGREWTARASPTGQVPVGKVHVFTLRGTVPRAKAESLAVVVRPPKTERKGAAPLPSLRFEP